MRKLANHRTKDFMHVVNKILGKVEIRSSWHNQPSHVWSITANIMTSDKTIKSKSSLILKQITNK